MSREDEIQTRLGNLATPGPWYYRHSNGSLILDKDGLIVDEPLHAMDAIFIANAPADIDYLLTENGRLREKLKSMTTIIDHARTKGFYGLSRTEFEQFELATEELKGGGER